MWFRQTSEQARCSYLSEQFWGKWTSSSYGWWPLLRSASTVWMKPFWLRYSWSTTLEEALSFTHLEPTSDSQLLSSTEEKMRSRTGTSWEVETISPIWYLWLAPCSFLPSGHLSMQSRALDLNNKELSSTLILVFLAVLLPQSLSQSWQRRASWRWRLSWMPR